MRRPRRLRTALLAAALAAVTLAPAAPFPRWAAVHEPNARYRLPFDLKIPRLLSQGVGDPRSHGERDSYHAFDFVMPVGTPVLCARGGRVRRVQDGDTAAGSLEADRRQAGNVVYVEHRDKTFAVYAHLRAGIPVAEGQRVARGTLLGYSGNTGYTAGPHLHFVVQRADASGEIASVPIRFGVGSRKGFVPEVMQYYGRPPTPNTQLRIELDGRPVPAEGRIPLARGQQAQLKALLEREQGGWADVTGDAKTVFATMTPWSVDVEPDGRVLARPDPDFHLLPDAAQGWLEFGTISVFHGDAGDPRVGLARVEFRIAPAP